MDHGSEGGSGRGEGATNTRLGLREGEPGADGPGRLLAGHLLWEIPLALKNLAVFLGWRPHSRVISGFKPVGSNSQIQGAFAWSRRW